MGNKSLAGRTPFRRRGSASAKIYAVLAKSSKPLPTEAVAKLAKMSAKQARTLLAAYMNPYHNAPLRRAGLAITSHDGAFKLVNAKPVPNAKRPARGAPSKAKKASKPGNAPKKKTSRKPKVRPTGKHGAKAHPPAGNPPSVESGSISASDGTQGASSK